MPVYHTRTAGIYRARFLGTEERNMIDQETQQEEPRWIWKFQELTDPTSAGQIDKITTTQMRSPNSNAYQMTAGIMGRKPEDGDDTDTHINDIYDLVYGPNRAGNLTITSVVPVIATPAAAAAGTVPEPATAPVPEPVPNGADELPF